MTDVRVSGVFRETLHADATATLNVSGIFREVLVSSETVLQVAGLFREVLRTNELPPPPIPPGPGNWWPWTRQLLAELEIEEAWFPIFRPYTVISARTLFPYKRVSFIFAQIVERENWFPISRNLTPPILFRKRMRPYLQINT